jgi:hypothetical protein
MWNIKKEVGVVEGDLEFISSLQVEIEPTDSKPTNSFMKK